MTQDFLEALPKHIVAKVDALDLVDRHDQQSLRSNSIEDVLSQTVLVGGKRLRPLLTFLMGDFLGADLDHVTPFAKASELVHAASLAHDDVIDQAQMRRGRPSINVVSSNKKAVLSGDYLLADVIVALSHYGTLDLLREMSLVIQELSYGEWLQLETAKNRDYTAQKIEDIARFKTSSVIRWCTVSSAIFCEYDSELIELCREFGDRLGLAFQLIDDTLDFADSKRPSGAQKDEYLDLDNGQVNSVVFSWLERHPEEFHDYKSGRIESLRSVLGDTDFSQDIEHVRGVAHNHLESCHQLLDKMEPMLKDKPQSSLAQKRAQKREGLSLILAFLAARSH